MYVVLEAMWFGSLLDVMRNGERPLFHHPEAGRCETGRGQEETESLQLDISDSEGDDDDAANEIGMLAISFQILWGLE